MHYAKKGAFINIAIDEAFSYSTLEEFFDALRLSKKQRYIYLAEKKAIYLDHEVIKDASMILPKGHQLRLKLIEKEDYGFIPEALFDLEVVYEDALLLIVNKPSGYIVHDEHQSLSNVVAFYYQSKKYHMPVRPIHRLDKMTSGLVFFSKLPFFQAYFDEAIAHHEIRRDYLAKVVGDVGFDTYTCNAAIAKDRHQNNHYIVSKNGKPSISHFKAINRTPSYSLVECRLETGRTHQIRVHLAHLHHPLIGDRLYNPNPGDEALKLFAYRLNLYHPLEENNIQVQLPIPEDF